MEIPIQTPSRYKPRDLSSMSLPSISSDDGLRGLPQPPSPSSESRPLSIRGSDNMGAPPALPPPRFAPVCGPVDPSLQDKYHNRRREFEGSASDPFDHLSFGRRNPFHGDLDEGYQSIENRSPLDLPSTSFGFGASFRPNNTIDESMVSRLDGRKRLDKRSPPRHLPLSSSANEVAPPRRALHTQLSQLSLPSWTTKNPEWNNGFAKSPLALSAVSPRVPFFPHTPNTDFRSPAGTEASDTDRFPLRQIRRTESGSVADDATTVSTQGSRDGPEEPDFSVDETCRMRKLYIDDRRELEREREFYQTVGQKRPASPDHHLPGDILRRRDGSIVSRGSPTPRLSVIPSRNGSFASNTPASSIVSMNAFGRRSPSGLSPRGVSPTEAIGSPYTTPVSLGSPRSSISRGACVPPPHQLIGDHNRAMASPRNYSEVPPTAASFVASKMKDPFMCQCCPKKPKKFDTEEELNAHAAEKQYECSFCGSRFKNKNEAERHQNSLHVRRYSWSCSALTGYERAFHESATRPADADVCGYCGKEYSRTGGPGMNPRFASDQDWEERIRHLQDVHKFRECNSTKKFFRADHFRQHLKHSHNGTSGKWTNTLESACMLEEEPPVAR